MTFDDDNNGNGFEPWNDPRIPAGFDARSIYEQARAVGVDRRHRRRRRRAAVGSALAVVVAIPIVFALHGSGATSHVEVRPPRRHDRAARTTTTLRRATSTSLPPSRSSTTTPIGVPGRLSVPGLTTPTTGSRSRSCRA